MASYALALKVFHLLCAVVFFGAGLGTAYAKIHADRSGDVRAIAWANAYVVHADLVFTIPSGLMLPLCGIALAHIYRMPLGTPWIAAGLWCYLLAGLAWFPAWILQHRMRALSAAALRDGSALPPAYHRLTWVWPALGVPSFIGAGAAMWVMTTKTMPW